MGNNAKEADPLELRALRDELALREKRFRMVSELTSDYAYAFRVSEDGAIHFEWATGALIKITGFTADELGSRGGWESLMDPEDLPVAREQLQQLLAGRSKVVDYRIVTKEGLTRWMRDHGRAEWDEAAGRTTHIYGAVTDITAHKRAEEELLDANAELRELDELKSNFISNISHELRTPLVSIRGYTELLAQSPESGAYVVERLGRVLRSIDRLERIVEDVLDYARIQDGTMVYRMGRVNLRRILEAALETLAPKARQKSLRMKVNLPAARLRARGDIDRLTSVLLNLIDNAIKYSDPEGVVTVTIEPGPDKQVAIHVTDQGVGVDAGQHERIFERFYQVDSSTTRSYGGAGVGLALVREIVLAHGGRLWLDSAPGQGSTFHVSLPAAD